MASPGRLLLTEAEAADSLSISEGTLRGQRRRGHLPAGLWVKPSPKRIGYYYDLLRRWVELGCPQTWPAGEPAARPGAA